MSGNHCDMKYETGYKTDQRKGFTNYPETPDSSVAT